MPEGDTLFAAQERLRPILTDQRVEEFWAPRLRGYRPRTGDTVHEVRAVGKHLLIEFDRGLTLQTHLGMTGSWRVLHSGADPVAARARNPRMRVTITTALGTACCLAAPTIATFVRGSEMADPTAHLGANIADPTLDEPMVTECLAEFATPTSLLVDLLLDQRIAAGIGNVYKSEVLHLHGLGPRSTLSDLGARDPALEHRLDPIELFRTAHRLMARNLVDPAARRSTTPGGAGRSPGYFVYGRYHEPCLRCETPIERTYNGTPERSTYWCRTCQPDTTSAPDRSNIAPATARGTRNNGSPR